MKFLCCLSVIIILLLSVRPCCADMDCFNKISLKKDIPSKSTSKDKECGGCSPFFSCGSCSGFTVITPVNYALIVLPVKKIEHLYNYNQPYLEDVELSIWQPPQLS